MIFRISDTMLSVRRGMLRVTLGNVPAGAFGEQPSPPRTSAFGHEKGTRLSKRWSKTAPAQCLHRDPHIRKPIHEPDRDDDGSVDL